ncbi:putative integral membrane protein [Mycobacteroides abscessus]|nr:putative integral membrane protein [Mycobacteroides abscessus]CPU62759.1 putative integral membrane protein [Mycobacteroides abscessus]SKQ36734.1 putative integral membrane protein [Mycobacteroides abscessus subsp. massiliense]SKW96866.1 putative integral membrane protein [Mycobacteroides abscessus subsp. massiliense]
MVARSVVLFVVAAIAEIGGAWLVWQGVREHRGGVWIAGGVAALGPYGSADSGDGCVVFANAVGGDVPYLC